MGDGAWTVNNGEGGAPMLVLNRSLEEIARISPPRTRRERTSEPFAAASLVSMKAAWLSWPQLFIGDLGKPVELVALVGEGDGYASSNCAFADDGRALYFVAPPSGEANDDFHLMRFGIDAGRLDDLGSVPAPEGRFSVDVLPSGDVFVTVEMGQNGGITSRKDSDSGAIERIDSFDWMFDVSADEERALGGDGDLTLFGWPSGQIHGTARVPGTVVNACFLDETHAVAFTAGDGAALVSLDSFEAGTVRPFGEGDDSWCLAHQDGVALAKIGNGHIATFDLEQLRR